ncbi:hypothetical protein BH23ACT5_BH23ACT5_23850 [soil metagenome]
MAVRGVDTVFYKVTDLERSVTWYRDVLGIHPGPRYGDWQILVVGGEVTFALHRFDDPHPGVNAVVALAVEDLNAVIDHAAAVGVQPVDAEVTRTDDMLFVTYGDPDGNHIQLIQHL